jgi:hypothetical protein
LRLRAAERLRLRAEKTRMVMARNQRAHWARQISTAWRSSIEAVFECGRLLIAAREGRHRLDHGNFLKMIHEDLPFGERTAQRLMEIVRDTRLTNPTHGSLLPQSWRSLYELTRLSDDQFATAIRDGLIRPDMRRSEIAEMVAGWEDAERLRQHQSQRATALVSDSAETQSRPLQRQASLSPTGYWPSRRPAPADRVETMTEAHLAELRERYDGRMVLESLLALERESTRCTKRRFGLWMTDRRYREAAPVQS